MEIAFEETMKRFAREVYPEEYSEDLFEARASYTGHAAEIFGDLYGIYEDREQYDLHWAFKDASRLFKEFSEHVPDRERGARPKSPHYNEYFDGMRNRVRKHIAATGRKYELLSFAVSFIDIAISVALILVVTALAQLGEKGMQSIVLLALFVAAVALAKVSLDRFLIIPKVEKLGWSMYGKLTRRVAVNAAKITAIRVIVSGTRERLGEDCCLVELCHRGFKEIKPDAADLPEELTRDLADTGGS